ncbi:MAG: Tex family protein [Acetanaerobacterium sp.]
MDILQTLTTEFSLRAGQVQSTVKLIDDGNTIPFIARYRKEVTGSLDDQVLRELFERLTYLRGLEKRKEEILSNIEGQGKLTDELHNQILGAKTLAEAEDYYRPYKQKRKTRASVARERGLEPLAAFLAAQARQCADPKDEAIRYIDEEKGVATAEDALQGAMDIIAEDISDNAAIRRNLRDYLLKNALIVSKAANKDDSVYSMYYDYSESAARIAGHRVLAVNRGEHEGFLKVAVECDRAQALFLVTRTAVKSGSPCTDYVRSAAEDSYDRLIFPSLEREVRSYLTETAATQAIRVFGVNLGHLLMQPPIKGCRVLGCDPGYRTGCKLAVVDETGRVLDTGVIYPAPPHNKVEQAKQTVLRMIKSCRINAVAIGNGTASRETEAFIAEVIRELPEKASYMLVSEAGASVYSASKLAAEEFPEYDVSLRSAVSIARRMQDPLAELVKIDPKAIGVGQYQHDMPAAQLEEALSGVVENCVNNVGVDLNTASHSLLARVAGINNGVAKNIVRYREDNGAFKQRKELLKVPKLGKKAFEQCAGFLRVAESDNVLDNTGVHPESYAAAKTLLTLCGYSLADVKAGAIAELPTRVGSKGGAGTLAQEAGVGVPTLNDIVGELLKPGRDPRDELPKPILRTDVLTLADLTPGMELSGTVRNVIDFGAFVDIGVHDDGLVHISQICDRYIKHPSEVLKVGDIVKVRVLDVDLKKHRVSLTMKEQKS